MNVRRIVKELTDILFYSGIIVFILSSFYEGTESSVLFYGVLCVFIVPAYIVFYPKIKGNDSSKIITLILKLFVYIPLYIIGYFLVVVAFGWLFSMFNPRTILLGELGLFGYFILFVGLFIYVVVRLLGSFLRNYQFAQYVPFIVLFYLSFNSVLFTIAMFGVLVTDTSEPFAQVGAVYLGIGGVVVSISLSVFTYIAYIATKKKGAHHEITDQ